MSSAYSEEVLCYGENNRGFGILCLSSKTSESPKPLVVMFNAGLLHRSEPYRLNTELARQIASLGYDSLRFDLSGKGDTPVEMVCLIVNLSPEIGVH